MSTYIQPNAKMLPEYEDCPVILRRYLNYIVSIRNLSIRTANNYYISLRLFFRFIKKHRDSIPWDRFDDITISDITADDLKQVTKDDVTSFLYFLATRGNEIVARSNKLSAIKAFFRYLIKEERFERNPAENIEMPKLPKRDPKYLQLNEAKSLLNASEQRRYAERDLCITTLFLHCGMRLSELIGINMESVSNDVLTVTGKGNKQRTVYLDSACTRAIDDWLDVRATYHIPDDEHALFVSPRTKKRLARRSVQSIIENELKEAGLGGQGFSTHKLRHTAATLLYEGGADVIELKEILGHEHTTTTEIYTHLQNRRLKKVQENHPLNG